MKVCFISHAANKDGAERALLELIDVLRVNNVDCHVFLPCDGPLIKELEKRKIPYCVIPYKWWMGKNTRIASRIAKIIWNIAAIIPIAIRIKRYKCDVVYTNTITISIGAFVAKLLRIPHIWHIHEFGYEHHGFVFDIGERLSLWLMDKLSSIFIVNSHAVANKFMQYFKPSKIKVVYQPVNIPDNLFKQKNTFSANAEIKCAIVGVLQEGKRQEDAILAIGELIKEGIRAKLYIIGHGDPAYREYLYNMIKKNGLESYVEFTGYLENPFPLMQKADVILVCSKYEGFGRVTVEAMKLGKPVIGARSGGTEELIQNGFNGLLFSPGDHKDCAEKIKCLYRHPDLAVSISVNAKRWAEGMFNKERFEKEIMAILQQFKAER